MQHPRTKCLVIGARSHARAVLGVLQEPKNQRRYEVIAVVDSVPLRSLGETVLGVRVVSGLDHVDLQWRKGCRAVFLAIGDNVRRRDLFAASRDKGFDCPNLISTHSVVSPAATVGIGNFIAPFAHVGPAAVLGDDNLINTQANIEHDVKLGSHNHIAPGAVILGCAAIGDACLVGSRAVLLEKISIGDATVVGAGAVVTKSIGVPGKVVAGVPAREIK